MGARDDLLATLTSNGVLAKLDCLYLFNAATEAEALVNYANPGTYDATKVGTPVFTPNRGFVGDLDTLSYISSNFNPSTAPSPKFTQNAASFSLWVNTSFATDESAGGFYDGTGGVSLGPRVINQTNACQYRLNQTSVTSSGATHTDAKGWWTLMRVASTGASARLNGVQFAINAQTSTAPKNGALRICGQSNTSISSHQIAVAAIGALTATDDVNLYNALVTYMAAVGNVASGSVSMSMGSVVVPNVSFSVTGEALGVSAGSVVVGISDHVSVVGEGLTTDTSVIPFPMSVTLTGQDLTLAQGDVEAIVSTEVHIAGSQVSSHTANITLNENARIYLTGQSLTARCSGPRWWNDIPNPVSRVWTTIG